MKSSFSLGGQGRICRKLGFKQVFKNGKDLERWRRGERESQENANKNRVGTCMTIQETVKSNGLAASED